MPEPLTRILLSLDRCNARCTPPTCANNRTYGPGPTEHPWERCQSAHQPNGRDHNHVRYTGNSMLVGTQTSTVDSTPVGVSAPHARCVPSCPGPHGGPDGGVRGGFRRTPVC